MADIGIIKFQLADLSFGMFADRILEIVRLTDFRAIPRPLPYVIGITELRHYIVVIVDLRKRLGLSPTPLDQGATMIVANISSGMIGLLVESISYFKGIPEEKILPPISIAGFPAKLLHGELAEEEEEDILIIPDFDKIFSSYIHMQLFPISLSEKIAFRFRATPGSITRTLENTLIARQYLDEDIIKKLPRSMSLPSVQVHKVTSYYPNFQPKRNTSKSQKQLRSHFPNTRAGDERYSSLFEQVVSQYTGQTYERAGPQPDLKTRIPTLLLPDSGKEAISMLEAMLHAAEDREEQNPAKPSVSSQRLLSHPDMGREAAKVLHMSPVRLTKYLTYYPPRREAFEHTTEQKKSVVQDFNSTQTAARSLEERLEELWRSHLSLEEVLHVVNDEYLVLTREHIRWLRTHYQIPLMKLARLIRLFPKLQVDLSPEDEKAEDVQGLEKEQGVHDNNNELEQPNRDYTFLKPQMSHSKFSKNIMRCLRLLSERELLADDHVIRYVAGQLRVPTCRLSKLRSYYQMK